MINFIAGFVFALICLQCYKLITRDEKTMKYLTSPVHGKFDFNWTTKQILAMFNENMSERWYEARAHCDQNVFMSILTALHLIWIVRTEMEYVDHDGYRDTYNYFHGLCGYNKVKAKATSSDFLSRIIDPELFYYYQTFICGHNVVHDFMTNTTYE